MPLHPRQCRHGGSTQVVKSEILINAYQTKGSGSTLVELSGSTLVELSGSTLVELSGSTLVELQEVRERYRKLTEVEGLMQAGGSPGARPASNIGAAAAAGAGKGPAWLSLSGFRAAGLADFTEETPVKMRYKVYVRIRGNATGFSDSLTWIWRPRISNLIWTCAPWLTVQ